MKPETQHDEQFVQLIVLHQPNLRAVVMSLMPGHPDVEDVIQEAWALIWRKRGNFELGSNFEAWIFTVARFKVMAHWQTLKRRREQALPEATLAILLDHAENEGFGEFDSNLRFLGECLNQLRPETRALVLRRYLRNMRIKQLAADLGRSNDSVKTTLYRVRSTLRDCIQRKVNQEATLS